MAFIDVHFRGTALVKWSNMVVILPEGPGPFPVLYLLHGLSDDYSTWLRRTSIERHLDGVPMIVVMPDGHRSFYINDPRPAGQPYEDHIIRDVIGFVDTTFRTIPERGGRAIGGLSMGGYGAMMLGLRHTDLFSVACSHSGALGCFHEGHREAPILDELMRVVGPDHEKYDCFALARKLANSSDKLAIRMDCGDKDFILEDSRAFHAHLTQIGVPHTYEEFPGDHNWAYWDVHIQDTIRFVRQNLAAMQPQA